MNIFSSQLLLDSLGSHGLYEWTNDGTYSFTLGRNTLVHFIFVGPGVCWYDHYAVVMNDLIHIQGGGGGGALYDAYAELPAGTYYIEILNSHMATSTVTYKGKTYTSYAGAGSWISLQNGYNIELMKVRGDITKTETYEISYQKTIVQETDGNSPSGNYGGASLYYGYGRGSDYQANNQTNGYVKVEY